MKLRQRLRERIEKVKDGIRYANLHPLGLRLAGRRKSHQEMKREQKISKLDLIE